MSRIVLKNSVVKRKDSEGVEQKLLTKNRISAKENNNSQEIAIIRDHSIRFGTIKSPLHDYLRNIMASNSSPDPV